jgi:hypothetical protein
MRVLTF